MPIKPLRRGAGTWRPIFVRYGSAVEGALRTNDCDPIARRGRGKRSQASGRRAGLQHLPRILLRQRFLGASSDWRVGHPGQGSRMKRSLFTLSTLILLGFPQVASAYEYRLQFTSHSGARGLIVAGYAFDGTTVIGNCSYYTSSPCSGRGCRPRIVPHYNTCTWDQYGTLLTMTPGAPTAPEPLYQNGTEIAYATNGASSTGLDIRNFGFVDTPSSHYTWQTP